MSAFTYILFGIEKNVEPVQMPRFQSKKGL